MAILLVAAVVCAIFGSMIGKKKGRPTLGVVLGLVLGVIGLVIIACIPATHEVKVKRELDRRAVAAAADQQQRLRDLGQ